MAPEQPPGPIFLSVRARPYIGLSHPRSTTREGPIYLALHLIRKMLTFRDDLLPKVMAVTAVVLVCVICPESAESQNGKDYETAHWKKARRALLASSMF